MFLGGCPCCGKKECWRCYGKGVCSVDGKLQTIKATAFQYLSFLGDNPSWQPDQSAETGLPVGFELFPYNAFTDENGDCNFLFHYESPEENVCEGSRTTVLDFYIKVNADETAMYFFPTGGKWLGSFQGGAGSDLNCFDAVGLDLGRPQMLVDIGKTGFIPSFGLEFSVELLSPGEETEYQCFDAPPDEDGWTPVGECSATEEECAKACGPCWRCYRKLKLEVCESQDIAATLEVISVSGFNGVVIDTSEETGLPVGTKFNLESVRPVSWRLCEFYFNYTSPVPGPCGPPFTGATTIGLYANLSGNQLSSTSNEVYGRGNDAVFLGDQQLSCGGIPNNRGGSFPWGDSRWGGFGRHQFTAPVLDFDTASRQIGEIVYEINVFDLSVDDPDIPEDLYDYQCFDAPPDEDGWTPVGECSATEEECNDNCCDTPPCTPGGRTMPTTTTGPGTELAGLLKMIGISPKEKGCQCKSHAKRMDREGPQWCRENIETILGWLQTESKKRKLPFVKQVAKQVVLLAIRRAEKKS